VLIVAVVWAAPAQGGTTKAIWGPWDAGAFGKYQELGVRVYQIQLAWNDVANAGRPTTPTDPADAKYNWPGQIQEAINNASARGMQVAVLVRETPWWANGSPRPGPNDEPPNPNLAPTAVSDYANFLTAARKKYPQVNRWMIWGEANRTAVWRSGPVKYADLLDAAYGALNPPIPGDLSANTVVGGMTFTFGDTSAATWIAQMRRTGGARPRMNEYGHNPFSRRCPDLALGPNFLQNGSRDISDADTLKSDVAAAFGSKPLWLSEYTVSSDRANRAFTTFVTRASQADWLTRSLRIAGAVGGVSGFGWFNLQDENAPNGLTSGLLDTAGNPKPAFTAYRRTTTNEGLPGPCSAAASPPALDRTKPRVNLSAASKIRLRVLLKKGYRFKYRCNEPCRASAALLIDKKTARRTGLKRRARSAVRVGKASKRLGPAGLKKMTVKLTRKAKRKLKRARRGKLTLLLTVTDAARNATKKRKNIRLVR
jgi:hypothetical protein